MSLHIDAIEVLRDYQFALTGARPIDVAARVDPALTKGEMKFTFTTRHDFEKAESRQELRLHVYLTGQAFGASDDRSVLDSSMHVLATFRFVGDGSSVDSMLAESEELRYALYAQVHPLALREFGRLLASIGARTGEGIALGVSLSPTKTSEAG